jgi:aryl-alcohol dehydrogenase-like predicted oxidoreductase
MLHHFDDYLCDKENVRTVMEELKASGQVRFIGASAYSHHDYAELADTGFDATQIPLNLFDWKQIENGGLKKLEQSGMMVFVRSVYLQGLVFQKPETLAPHMEFARPTLEKFQYLCKKYELTPAALALSYALSLPGVTSLVLGSEKAEQVQQNLALMDQAVELNAEQMAEIRELFLDTPEQVLNPALWPKP